MFDNKLDSDLARAMDVFKELKPEFQDYVLQQTDKLLALQNEYVIAKPSPQDPD
ncbi:MAG: hypothetical protein LBQ15_01965 [Clostridium sp.]|jgi:hypothetical protein|nr:hypothetical protein [Clostridium sp.]